MVPLYALSLRLILFYPPRRSGSGEGYRTMAGVGFGLVEMGSILFYYAITLKKRNNHR
jgi:hypothetical protein